MYHALSHSGPASAKSIFFFTFISMSLRFSVAICIFDLIGCNYKTLQEQEQEVSVSRIRQCCLNSRQISFWCCTRYDASDEKPPWCKIQIITSFLACEQALSCGALHPPAPHERACSQATLFRFRANTLIFHTNRPFATNDHMVHGGRQAHCYSRTGTSKQRQVKLHWFRSLCFNVPVRE